MKANETPIFPFLLAIYPILTVSAENVEWAFSVKTLLFPVLLSLFVAVTGWMLAQRLFSGRRRGITATVLWVVFWLWYAPFVQAFAWLTRQPPLETYSFAFPVWLAALGMGALVLEKSHLLSRSTAYLNAFSAILVLFPVLTLVRGPSTQPSEWDDQSLPSPSSNSVEVPDIYFIILDGYSSTESLREIWGHDNHPFEDRLRKRGFFVPSGSHSNYVHTHLSLASMLNWQHLLKLKDDVGDGRDRSYAYAMIEDNRAARFLRSIGYEFVFFPTTFPGTHRNRLADRQIPDPPIREKNLLLIWFAQTPVTALVQAVCKVRRCESKRFPYPVEVAEEFEWKFEHLSQMSHEPEKKFVLAHMLLPHPPYVFRRDCSAREPTWPSSGDRSLWPEVRRGYVDQVNCLNQMLLDLIDDLLENSTRPPIIILQADHGHGRIQLDPMINVTIPLEELDQSDIEDRTKVFAAYYLPGVEDKVMYDSITPVNVLPAIFNTYFGTQIPLQEDATYWSQYRHSYVFTRIDRNSNQK